MQQQGVELLHRASKESNSGQKRNMLIRIYKRYTTSGLREALWRIRGEYLTLRKHRRGLRNALRYSGLNKLKLHLACGPNLKKGWVNIDLHDKADLTIDLREPLPFSNDSCSVIYSEHFLEHVDYPDGITRLLDDCFRVLEPGGLFSAGVPDTEWPLLEYAKVKDEGYFACARSFWHPRWCETEMEHINYHFREGKDHLFAYDFDTLKHVLTKAGFVNVSRRLFNPQMDCKTRELGTLYIDAEKPLTR